MNCLVLKSICILNVLFCFLLNVYVLKSISSLSAVISMAQAVPNLCVSRKVFLKYQVSWNTVCGAIQELPWRDSWLADDPVEVFPAGGTFGSNQGHPCT